MGIILYGAWRPPFTEDGARAMGDYWITLEIASLLGTTLVMLLATVVAFAIL